ncbi:MAG: alpha,alpha-trehalose-phosphate synthase [Acidimicrobiales bacterium]|nr:alpha,alpha-trehalose-phosphate synthase [Acidimicrobiales bacterium]
MVVVSNRGPLSFTIDDEGGLIARRGAGGLVSSLAPLVRGTGATWMAAAISDGDRAAAGGGVIEAEGFRFRSLAIDPDVYRMAYDVISNGTLWFLHHGLFDLPRRPRIDRRWREAWDAYRHVNHVFARALIDEAPEGATVLVQDYHLALVGTWLAQQRRDLRAVHFTHIPFCGPNALRLLPTDAAEELLVGMASHASCGFHARRWADNYVSCCREVLGLEPSTFVSPLAPDHDDIAAVSDSAACTDEMAWLDGKLGGRKLILRVDRIELSKNLLRGFHAFDDLLQTRPEWRGQVVFGALVYPSREGLVEYLSYRQEVEGLARLVNERWGTADWTPILLDMSDNFPRSVAALKRYDVLLVNPVRDGLNLVAKEGPLLNTNDGVLALSREAGAWEELAPAALEVNPFDVAGTADVLAVALAMSAEERADRAIALRKLVEMRTPRDWFDEQLSAARAER